MGSAITDRSALKKATAAGLQQEHPVTRRVVGASLGRELIRIGKHLLIITAIFTAFVCPLTEQYIQLRNWIACLIALGLAHNSIRDHCLQRYAMNNYCP